MTMTEAPPASATLAFGATFRGAFKVVFGRPGLFLKAAAVPFLLSLAIEAAYAVSPVVVGSVGGLYASDVLEFGLVDLAFGLLALLPFAVFGIALTRLLLIGPQAGALPSPLLGGRTWRYFGYSLLLTFAFVFIPMVGFFGMSLLLGLGTDAGGGPNGAWLFGAAMAGLLLLFYLFVRLSLVYPAVSMDDRLGLRGSWRLTRGNSMKLLGVLVLLILVLILVMLVGSAVTGEQIEIGSAALLAAAGAEADWTGILLANAPRQLWGLVANFLFFGLMTGTLTSAYAQLTSWGSPRAEILERFE